MSDLATRIREHYESAGEPVTIEEITAQEATRPDRLAEGTNRRIHGWAYALAVAGVVLAFGLLTFLTRQTVPEAPVASQPSPSPTVATPAPVPSVPIEESVSDWSRVPHDESVFGGPGYQWMVDVTVGGPGFVAVGGDSPSGQDEPEDAAVWTSVDGVSWSRVPYDETVFGGAEMVSVTAGGPGLVVVGGDTVWTSVDGVSWSRVPYDETVFGGASINSVTVGGPGLVAVGEVSSDAAVWTSVDGFAWLRIPHDEAVFGGADDQVMNSVTAGGPGLVAVGSDRVFEENVDSFGNETNTQMNAAVWTSRDGISWSRVPNDDTVFGNGEDNIGSPEMLDVTTGGPGLVAVGVNRGEVPVWTSIDGITWTPIPSDWRVFNGGEITSVTVGGPGLVAVGDGLYESADGITWTWTPTDPLLNSDGYFPLEDVAVGGPGLVAVGSGDGDAAVWVWGG